MCQFSTAPIPVPNFSVSCHQCQFLAVTIDLILNYFMHNWSFEKPSQNCCLKERYLPSLSNKWCCILNTTAGLLLLRHMDYYYFKLWKMFYWLNLMKITSNLNKCVGSNDINLKWATAKWEIFIVQWVISWWQCYFLRGKQSRHHAHPLVNSYCLFPGKTTLATDIKCQCYD